MKVLLLTIATMLGLSAVLLPPALSVSVAQTTAASMPGAALGPSDTYFVSQTSLGTRFRLIPAGLPKPRGRPKFVAMRT